MPILLSLMLSTGTNLTRINTAKNTIEYSTNNGRSWITCYTGSSCGTFIDLLQFGSDLLAATSKGIYASTNGGRSWVARYTGSSCGTFQALSANGTELLAQTDKGLYYSTNGGRSWIKRR